MLREVLVGKLLVRQGGLDDKADCFEAMLLEDLCRKALVGKIVLVEAGVLEVLGLQALLLCKGCNDEAEVFKALVLLLLVLLLEAKLQSLRTVTGRLKLIKVQAVKLGDVQQAGGKAMVSSPP